VFFAASRVLLGFAHVMAVHGFARVVDLHDGAAVQAAVGGRGLDRGGLVVGGAGGRHVD
jgi:hypothetical protein